MQNITFRQARCIQLSARIYENALHIRREVVRAELYESLKWCFRRVWRHRFQRTGSGEARQSRRIKVRRKVCRRKRVLLHLQAIWPVSVALKKENAYFAAGIPLSRESFARDQLERPRNHANTFHRKLRSRCAPLAGPHFLFALT